MPPGRVSNADPGVLSIPTSPRRYTYHVDSKQPYEISEHGTSRSEPRRQEGASIQIVSASSVLNLSVASSPGDLSPKKIVRYHPAARKQNPRLPPHNLHIRSPSGAVSWINRAPRLLALALPCPTGRSLRETRILSGRRR